MRFDTGRFLDFQSRRAAVSRGTAELLHNHKMLRGAAARQPSRAADQKSLKQNRTSLLVTLKIINTCYMPSICVY